MRSLESVYGIATFPMVRVGNKYSEAKNRNEESYFQNWGRRPTNSQTTSVKILFAHRVRTHTSFYTRWGKFPLHVHQWFFSFFGVRIPSLFLNSKWNFRRKRPRTTIIRTHCVAKHARKCPNSDNFRQNTYRMAVIWTHKMLWTLEGFWWMLGWISGVPALASRKHGLQGLGIDCI